MSAADPQGGTLASTIEAVSAEEQARLIKKFDHESNFRRLVGPVGMLVTTIAVILSSFHIYTAGFGLLVEIKHRAFHLALVLGLIFLVFPRPAPSADARGAAREWGWALAFAAFYLYLAWDLVARLTDTGELKYGGAYMALVAFVVVLTLPIRKFGGYGDRASLIDWPLALLAAGVSLYQIVFFDDIFIRRVGSPIAQDYMMGVLAIIMVMEATRRTMGPLLPMIGMACLLYALLGRYMPGVLAHRGYSVVRVVNHIYVGTEGHLRHRGRRGGDVRVPLRAVRRARADDGPRAAVHGARDHRRRTLLRRAREGVRGVVGTVRHDFRIGRRQRRDHRLADDSADEEIRILAALRRRSRGVGVVRRTGDAAGDGRVRVRDGGAPGRAVQGARDHRHRAGAVPLFRDPADGPLRVEAPASARSGAGSHPHGSVP